MAASSRQQSEKLAIGANKKVRKRVKLKRGGLLLANNDLPRSPLFGCLSPSFPIPKEWEFRD
jgi:hypothetical protein